VNEINLVEHIVNGGPFGVIAALIFLLAKKDKEMNDLRSIIGDLVSAISGMSETQRQLVANDGAILQRVQALETAIAALSTGIARDHKRFLAVVTRLGEGT